MSKTTVRDIAAAYRDGDPITMLTAYDAPIARLVEFREASIDRCAEVGSLLVGEKARVRPLGRIEFVEKTVECLTETLVAAFVRFQYGGGVQISKTHV
jgi:3-methyl-2-oxobutanoate hydroxymethyltransferase